MIDDAPAIYRAWSKATRKPPKRRRRSHPQTSSDFMPVQIAALPDTGSVYFIQGVDGGPIKIGKANDPLRRLACIQAYSPVPLRILAVEPGGMRREYTLHRQFKAARLHGEWFEPTPTLLRIIARAQKGVHRGGI